MRVAIIGAGAAGLMCAATLIEKNSGAEIIVIERNDGLGKKVIISGGGRCNVTTGIHDVKTLLTKYPRGAEFLRGAMTAFPPKAVYNWFQAHGVPLKMQADLRAFPASDDGHDIVGVFEKLFAASRVNVMLKASVEKVEKRGEEFVVHIKGNAFPIIADVLVLTTGGQAYRHTGSTGDGYAFAIALGHTVTPLAPSLNAFFTREVWPKEISGLSFEDAEIVAHRTPEQRFRGPFLFTHKGISGPAVFALSSLVAFEKYDAQNPLAVTVDLFPDVTLKQLTKRIHEMTTSNPHKRFVNILASLVPKSLVDVMMRELHINEDKPAGQAGKNDFAACARWLKAIPLTVVQRGAGDEFVTAGGVTLTEVDATTMQSRICPGLYFAGELLDVDGFTGGFNLQASWAAGRLAGSNIAHSSLILSKG